MQKEDGHFDTPNAQRNRVIPIGFEASNPMRVFHHGPVKPEDLVFSIGPSQPLNRHNLARRQLRPACKKLGLSGIAWHSFRHSHAKLLDAVGAPLGTVQALLDHATSKITREVHLHSIPKDQRRQSRKLNHLLWGLIGLKRTQL